MNENNNGEKRQKRPHDRSNFGAFEEDASLEAPVQPNHYRRRINIPEAYSENLEDGRSYGDPFHNASHRAQISRQNSENTFYADTEDAPDLQDDLAADEYFGGEDGGIYEDEEGHDDRGEYTDPGEKSSGEYSPIEQYDDDLTEYDEFGRKRRPSRRAKKMRARAVWGWIISIAAAVAVAFVIRAFVFEPILVDGESMLPTLQTDERLAVEKVSRYFNLPERGDIIIVHYPNMDGTYVKRVIGLPGETVEVKNSTVYINGQALSENYINPEPYADMALTTVPEDSVFVMGDNRAHSLDSRTSYIGAIPKDQIVGHAMFVIWPLNKIHTIN